MVRLRDVTYTQGDPIGLEGGVESIWVCGRECAEFY